MEINSPLLREKLAVNFTLAANGVIGTAPTAVDIVSHIGVIASAAGLVLTLPAPTDTRAGRDFRVVNAGALAFELHNKLVGVNDYADFNFDGAAWRSEAPSASATTQPTFTKVAINTTATTAPGRVIAYFVDASGGPRTITLPLASTAANQTVRIKKVDSSVNAVTVARAGADLIDGAASFTISAQYDGFDFLSDSPNATWNLF